MRRRWLRKRAARKETFAIDTSLGRVRSSETTQVVDATQFIDTHPGGLRKLMSTDDAGIGAGPEAFSFSFSRGRNVLDQCLTPSSRRVDGVGLTRLSFTHRHTFQTRVAALPTASSGT